MNESFKNAIEAHLQQRAAEDELFAETFKKEGKNIDDCCTYIINRVKKEGEGGYPDDVIFGYAVHYYDEDKIDIGAKDVRATVVVNHEVVLTEQEIAEAKIEAKRQAIQKVINEEKTKLKKVVADEPVELSPADIEEARKAALKKAIAAEEARIAKKPVAKKPAASSPVQQPSLF